MTKEELLELKEDIENSKQKIQQLKGEEKALLSRLKKEWNCSTLKEAKKKLKKLEAEQQSISVEIDTGLEELEESLLNVNEEE